MFAIELWRLGNSLVYLRFAFEDRSIRGKVSPDLFPLVPMVAKTDKGEGRAIQFASNAGAQ